MLDVTLLGSDGGTSDGALGVRILGIGDSKLDGATQCVLDRNALGTSDGFVLEVIDCMVDGISNDELEGMVLL